jgi:rubrerythrin
MPTPLTRARFIANAGKGSLALVSGGALLASVEGVAFGAPAKGDVAIAKVAYTAENLAIKVYEAAIRSGKVNAQKAYLQSALRNERDHFAALGKLLGTSKPRLGRVKLPALRTANDIVNLALSLETAFTAAYVAAVKQFKSPALKVTAAGIAANEAAHYGFFLNLKNGRSIPSVIAPGDLTKITRTVKSFYA